MLSLLKNHPFAVEAFFESSIVLTFAIPKEQLINLIPDFLELNTFNNQWGFIAVAMVSTKNLRPKGFPEFLGNDFFLIGYRIFVQYRQISGKQIRGLYIIKSETNKKKMEFFGNIFTHYNYTTTDISISHNSSYTEVISTNSRFCIQFNDDQEDIPLPEYSPFNNWKEARKFAGPLPFTFTANNDKILIIEGIRSNWRPKPITILDYQLPFIDSLNLKDPVLANSFIIKDIPYYWKKGRQENWSR